MKRKSLIAALALTVLPAFTASADGGITQTVDSVSAVGATTHWTITAKFDGKDYADLGPRIAHGSTSSARRIDEHTIQVTDKLNGKATDTRELKVSEDGRTLTDKTHVTGEQKPLITVWQKQM